ncbi:hypothetical protein ACFWXK_08935 [Streptomyces sp. NPDC059070]|uniref:hypothetical protein n=1 Tax=unclassified Streptomyces TaxID=2593676 RepID=UPI0034E1A768
MAEAPSAAVTSSPPVKPVPDRAGVSGCRGIGAHDRAFGPEGESWISRGPGDVLLPAGTVKGVDVAARKVYVSRTKEEIKNAPEFDKEKHLGDADYHQSLGTYYQTPRNTPRM